MKKFLKGFLVGSTLGGLSSLFLAQSSGKDTRDSVKQSLHDAVTPTKDMIESVTVLKSAVQTVSHHLPLIQQTSSDIQERLRHFSEDTQPRIKRIKQHIEAIQQHLKK